jgi:hypothetical protein
MSVEGCAQPVYRIYGFTPDGRPHMLRDYNSASTFTWDTTTWATGGYWLEVDVKDQRMGVDIQSKSVQGYTITP